MIGVVIPVLNERPVLGRLYDRLRHAAESWGDDWEVLFVDDGSTDGTFEELQQLNQRDPHFKAISFSRNFGHQTAVTAGLRHVRGDAVIVMDADLQDPPEAVGEFIARWREGYQVVYAVRTQRKENAFKRAAYFLFYRLLARLSSIPIPLDSGDFCLMDRVVVDHLNAMPERNRFIRGLRCWVGFKQIGVTYERQARQGGDAKYTFRKLVKLALDGVVDYSYKPLVLFGAFGFVVAFLSFVAMSYTFIAWLFDIRVRGKAVSELPGYTTIALSILFIGGVQLMSLGILGQYVARIFDEVKRRPPYIIRSSAGVNDVSSPAASDRSGTDAG